MTLLEFNALRLGDPVLSSTGKIVRAYDIDRRKRAIKTSHFGGAWRDFHAVALPHARRKTGQRLT